MWRNAYFILQADSDSDFEPEPAFEEDEDDFIPDLEEAKAGLEDLDNFKKASKTKKKKASKKVIYCDQDVFPLTNLALRFPNRT